MVDAAARSGFGHLTLATGGRVLPLGQAVYLVIEEQYRHVEVAAQGLNQLVPANAQGIAVAGYNPDLKVGIGQLNARGHRRSPTVQRMHSVAVDVVGQSAAAANSADQHGAVWVGPSACEHFGKLLEDAVVPATRAPANVLWALKILAGQFHSSASSAGLKGWPVVLQTDSRGIAQSP